VLGLWYNQIIEKRQELEMKCGKCGGRGYIKEYHHVSNGVCFECNGVGRVNSDGSQIGVYTLFSGDSPDNLSYETVSRNFDALRNCASELNKPYMEITTQKGRDKYHLVWCNA
jgi:hypothetical protein